MPTFIILNIAFVCIGITILASLYRIITGPTWGDRIGALDLLSGNVALIIVIIVLRTGDTAYLDVALLVAILGFLTTVALARHLLLGRVL